MHFESLSVGDLPETPSSIALGKERGCGAVAGHLGGVMITFDDLMLTITLTLQTKTWVTG